MLHITTHLPHYVRMMIDPTSDLSPPTFSKLLGLIPPSFTIAQEDSLKIAVKAAIDCGIFEAGECDEALDALIGAARASTSHAGSQCAFQVIFPRTQIHSQAKRLITNIGLANLAGPVCPELYISSDFYRCLGGIPAEVRMRARCAAERPKLAPILTASAIDHLVESVLWLAARIPGAQRTQSGNVELLYISIEKELPSTLAWMALPGPGLFAQEMEEIYNEF